MNNNSIDDLQLCSAKEDLKKINRAKLIDACYLINDVLNYDINLFRPFEVKKLYDAKNILFRHAFKNYPE